MRNKEIIPALVRKTRLALKELETVTRGHIIKCEIAWYGLYTLKEFR